MTREPLESGGVSLHDGPIPHWHSPEGERLSLVEGDGMTVVDDAGTEYLDFVSQLYCVNAGHGNESIIDAITAQLNRIPYVSSAKHNDVRHELAAALSDVAPGTLDDVFFSISGSEANETAMTIARKVQDAPKVLSRWQSYHGGTYGAGSYTGDPTTRSALEKYAGTTNSGKFLPPLPSAFGTHDPDELAQRAADHVEFVLRNENPDSVAAILTEPIGGTSGAYPAPPGYFQRLREICDEHDVLLVSDEVITGFGRCGEWFGIETEDVVPDMITFAKGITSAYVPLAGVIVDESIGDTVRGNEFELGQTFAGHPVGCAAGLAALDVYESGLIENVNELAAHVEGRLAELESEYDVVRETRGRGFLHSVVFADPDTGDPFVDPWSEDFEENPVATIREAAQERGALFGSGRPDVQIIVAPPLCATRDELDRGIDVLGGAIEDVFY